MLRTLLPPPRTRNSQVSATYVQPREVQRGRAGEHEDELITALAEQLSGRTDRARIGQQPMGD